MCFSASASLIAGASLSAAGVVTIKKAKRKPAALPFASIPLLFGIQQIVEGFVWLSLTYEAAAINTIVTFVYLLFSHVFWPIFIPFAVMKVEKIAWRKKVISVFQGIGIFVGMFLLYTIIRFPISSKVIGESIVYGPNNFYVIPILALYFVATCASCFFSSLKLVNIFGVLVFISSILAYWLYTVSFVSSWCFFSGILSFVILKF